MTSSSSVFLMLLLLLLRSDFGQGFAASKNNGNNPFQSLFGSEETKVATKTPPTRQDGDKFLKELGLTSSTTPALASAPLSAIPALLVACIPAVLRLGSGVFGLNYRLQLVRATDDGSSSSSSKDEYSYIQAGNLFRTKETCDSNKIPALPIILFETEADPSCRAVREACSMLSLTVNFRPGKRFASQIKYYESNRRPILKDPSSGREIDNGPDAIAYLFEKYGNGQTPWTLSNEAFVAITGFIGLNLARLAAPKTPPQTIPPEQPLVLWAYEGSPFCLLPRQLLNNMELEHIVKYTPRGSPNRQALYQQEGRFQVPCLQDPNTGVVLFESQAIVEYVQKVYGRNVRVKYM